MLWNSLSSARAGLKTPGAGPWHSAALTLSWGWLGRFSFAGLGRNQPRFVVLPYSRCSVKSVGRALLTACPPHSPPVPAGPGFPRPRVGRAEGRCSAAAPRGSAKADSLGESSSGCCQPRAVPRGVMQRGWCDMKTTSADTLEQEPPLSVHQPTLICKLGCDKTN